MDRSLGHPRNLGPSRSPQPGHRRPLHPPDATATCLPHTHRVTGLVQKGPRTAGVPRAGSGVRTPPQRPQAQRPGAAPCPPPFSAGNNRHPCFRPPPPLPAAQQLQGRTGRHRPRARGGRPGQEAGQGVRRPGNGSLEKQLLLPGSSQHPGDRLSDHTAGLMAEGSSASTHLTGARSETRVPLRKSIVQLQRQVTQNSTQRPVHRVGTWG